MISGANNELAWLEDSQAGGLSNEVNKWEIQLWAVSPSGSWMTPGQYGWWTANDYGANSSPYDHGWRSTGPPLWQAGRTHLCDRYDPVVKVDSASTAFFNQHRGGWAYWQPVGDGSPF